ncbi:hypothetical protein ACSBR1_017229 [Camellia fascicularis]
MRSSNEFSELKGIGDLTRKLVETKKNIVYPLVYLLVKLALILPVANATVERAFSVMKFIKNRLRNQMGDQWLNDCLVTYIEKDVFDSVDNELIMQRFQNMKSRRESPLTELIRFGTEVVRVERVDLRNDEWVVESRTSESNREEVFEAVVVCNGHNTRPRVANLPG